MNSLHLLGVALLYQDKVGEAIESLERAVAARPNFWQARTDLGPRLSRRRTAATRPARSSSASLPPRHCSRVRGSPTAMCWSSSRNIRTRSTPTNAPDWRTRNFAASSRPREALAADDHKTAETIFRDILRADPAHVAALCGLAAVSLTASRAQDAVRLLKHAQKQSAYLPLTRRGLSQALLAQGALPEAESTVRGLLKMEGENPNNWVLLATVYTRLMRQEDALAAFEEAARLNPGEVRLRLSVGHLNKTIGRRARVRTGLQTMPRDEPGHGRGLLEPGGPEKLRVL